MKNLFKILLCCQLCLLLVFVAVVSAASVPSYKQVRQAYIALLGSPQKQRQRRNWEKVIRQIEAFNARSKDDQHLDDGLYMLGRTWHGLSRASGRRSDAQRAVKIYERLAARYPQSNLTDDGLIFAADLALNVLQNPTSAYNYYLQITSVLPAGDMLPQAEEQLRKLKKGDTKKRPATVRQDHQTQPVPSQEKARLESVRVWNSAEYTRVVIDLNRAVAYEAHQLSGDKPRIYLDLAQISLAAGVTLNQTVQQSVVRRVRSQQVEAGRVRVVLDVSRKTPYQVFSLTKPNRIVIDVQRGSKTAEKVGQTDSPDSIAGLLNGVPNPDMLTLHVPQSKAKRGIRLIVVDAGHGGKDPGAVGRHKTREKDVTLQMAQRLAKTLRKQLKCKVLLTRSDDRYIALHARTAYANRVGADLFISLHANASLNRKAYGLETYYLNLSKNNQAAEVAARENGTSLEEVGNLEAILFDLMANAKINESSRLAAEIQQSLIANLSKKFSRIKNLGVKQGPFHVLLGATMPSVLVETAFLSNNREEKRLKNSGYQQRVADAIVRGVKDYSQSLNRVAHR